MNRFVLLLVGSFLLFTYQPSVHANLLGNADFEAPVGTGMDTNWALLGGNEQQIGGLVKRLVAQEYPSIPGSSEVAVAFGRSSLSITTRNTIIGFAIAVTSSSRT